jgi:translation initiation factor IF-2
MREVCKDDMMDKKEKKETSSSEVIENEIIEEKRIKPTVIRRRFTGVATKAAKAPAKTEEKVVPEEAKEAEKKEAKKEAVEAKVKPERKKEAPGEKAEKKAKVAEITTPSPVKGKKERKPPHKPTKKVTVFAPEDSARKKISPKRPVFYKGQFYRGREERHKKYRLVSSTRELKKTEITVTKEVKRVIKIADAISVSDLSQRLGVKAGEIIKKLISLDIMATINQMIDVDAAALVAHDFGYNVESIAPQEEMLMSEEAEGKAGELTHRPPVVTVMGHVDHGKTSLLDAIRKTNVVEEEFGGITQHIGAYHVHLKKGDVTFLDTPGHEAFTAMRARGAKVTDIVILVVAADDGVMPQTIEAINHAKAAKVPIIVAVNKIDLSNADAQKVRQELTQYGLVSEEWGGDTIFAEISAKKGTNIKELLELVLLQAEMLELKANASRPGRGVIIEAKLDKGRGPVATVLVYNGSINIGDAVISGVHWGRVRAMISDWGKKIDKAGPSMPVEIIGLSGVPEAGDVFMVVKDEATTKQIIDIRVKNKQKRELGQTAKVSLEDLYNKIKEGEIKELGIVIKGDVQGSVEAVRDILEKLSTDAIKLNITHSAAGGINEGDIMLASTSNAIIIGFNVRPEPKVAALATKEGVDIRLYNVIYDVAEDIKKAMEGMLAPIVKEKVLGRAEVRQVFKVSKVGNIAGSYVVDGKIQRGTNLRLIRDGVVIYEGKLSSLKRFNDDVKEVASGFECGISIEGYNDIKVGDAIEAYVLEETAAKL